MEPVDGETFVSTPDFSTPGGWFQHLNKGERVVTGANLAGEQKDESPKRRSESGVINEGKITSFPAVKLWTATQVICPATPIHLRFVINLEEPVFDNLDVIQVRHRAGS